MQLKHLKDAGNTNYNDPIVRTTTDTSRGKKVSPGESVPIFK